MNDVHEAARAARRQADAERMATLAAAMLDGTAKLSDVAQVVEMKLDPGVDVADPYDATRTVRLHRVVAQVSRMPQATNDDDREGYTQVTGYGRLLNSSGEPDGRATREQEVPLPEALAAQILYLAATRSQ